MSSTTAVATATATASHKVAEQGGIIEGVDPSVYDAKNPVILFIIQTGIIIIFCRLLHFPLSKLRQPRVIAEVIGGILLGPSVMMRIPGFEDTIFPPASMPNLNLVANLGLILFLFLVGLEVNMRMFLANWKVALSVGLAGMALPFALGSAIAWGLYNQFRDDPNTDEISFGVYMLFVGTALSITAFPVLCRILTELQLLHTSVGVTVLAAGVGNDVIGWILLALCVALVNNGSGVTAVYVLLTAIAWVLFLVYAIRPAFMYILRRSGSLEKGPSQAVMALTLLLTLASAWFTAVIGVHAIFGAFLLGLICPHDGGFARKVTEKIEDLVSVLLLPLYFALSGLSTNLGLLSDGITWGYVIGVIAIAFFTKVVGGALAARLNKLVWRESFTIGVLMSCKGLVELIVLNIGLQARILSTRTFTIFVVMALVTTVATTPLTISLYPPHYQRKLEAWKRGEIDWSGNRLTRESEDSDSTDVKMQTEKPSDTPIRRLLVYLRLDSLPSLFTVITLLGGDASQQPSKTHHSKALEDEATAVTTTAPKRPLEVHGLRMLELTERTSTVMQVTEVDSESYRDPVINTFRTFAQLHNVAASGCISVVPESEYASKLSTQATEHSCDLVVIPWSLGRASVLDIDTPAPDALSGGTQEWFVQCAFDSAACDTALFIDRGFGGAVRTEIKATELSRIGSKASLRSSREREAPWMPVGDRSHHVYMPFLGGPDDRVALRFVLQLAGSSNVTVTVVHFIVSATGIAEKAQAYVQTTDVAEVEKPCLHSAATPRPVAEHTVLERGQDLEKDRAFVHGLRDTLPSTMTDRVVFLETATDNPVRDAVERCKEEIGQSPRNAGDLIVVGRGGRGDEELVGAEMGRLFGGLAEGLLNCGARGSVVVVKAARE